MPKAIKFSNWVTHIVLPSIRKYGIYKIKKEHEDVMKLFTQKINKLEEQNKLLQNNLKKECCSEEWLVYAIDYTEDYKDIYDNVYRIGKTNDINKRQKIYNTHHLRKRKVIYKKETRCPLMLRK